MKENIKKLKELWQNKRYRSLFILAIYAIFFTIVILIFSPRDNNFLIQLTPLEVFENQTEYELSYTDNQTLDHMYYVIINNDRITVKNKNFVEVEVISESQLEATLKFNPKEIVELIKSSEVVSELNKPNENYKEVAYQVEDKKINEKFNNSTLEIIINIYQKDNIIEKVSIDFINYYEIENLNLVINSK